MPRIHVPGRDSSTSPTSSLTYFAREALRRIWVSKRTSFAAIGMIALALMILGMFLLVSENLGAAVREWQGKSRVTIYLSKDAMAESIRAIDAHLGKRPLFANRQFVSQGEARQKFKSFFANLAGVVDELGENPFPASFEINLPRDGGQGGQLPAEVAAIRKLPGVDDVQLDWEWIARLRNLVRILNLIGLTAGGILALAAAFMIANVIRLTMVTYREEIDIMRLVGATERIVRGPFLFEGLIQGTLGGLLAIGLLYAAFAAGRNLVTASNALIWNFLFVSFLPWQKVAALVAGGTLAGLLGSWLSLRGRTDDGAA